MRRSDPVQADVENSFDASATPRYLPVTPVAFNHRSHGKWIGLSLSESPSTAVQRRRMFVITKENHVLTR